MWSYDSLTRSAATYALPHIVLQVTKNIYIQDLLRHGHQLDTYWNNPRHQHIKVLYAL